MNCAKCNRDVTNSKNAAKCVDCNSYYHATCCRIRTLSKLTSMSVQTLATWRCDECASDASSIASLKSESDDPKIFDILQSIQRDIASSQRTNKTGFDSVNKNLANMQTSIDELRQKLSSVERENADLKSDFEKLYAANNSLGSRVYDLEMHVQDLQQYSRNRNVEIKGVPLTKNEDVYLIIESVSKALGIEYDRLTISIAHRLPVPKVKRFHPSIIVQFVSRSTRSQWIAAARKKKLQTTDLAPTLRPSPVFIVDHLTQQNKHLLGHAKSLVKEGHLAFAWSREGKIIIRKSADSEAKRVRSVREIDDIAGHGTDGGARTQVTKANTSSSSEHTEPVAS